MTTSDEQVALCALNKVFGFFPLLGRRLLEERGGALAVFNGPRPQLREHPELAEALTQETLEWARRELEQVRQRGFRFLGLYDEDYPEALAACEDPPLGLYLNGVSSPTEIFGLRPLVAIVGTRDLSPYGRLWCQKLVQALSRARVQPAVVSGLALGADGVAHQAALEEGLPTIGVMATGIDKIYPFQHESLAVSIAGTPGCALLTDYPLGTAPVALHFLRRNRIIAGLVSAVVVIESRTKGGSLMTAKYACSYARDVFALPGRLDDARSAGCNSLIASQMAQIIASPEQLVEDLGLGRGFGTGRGRPGVRNSPKTLREHLEGRFGASSALVGIGMAIRDQYGIMPDQLATRLGLPIATVLEGIGLLEAEGIVTSDLLRRCSLTPAYI